jgi:PAS domain S-box-containing protein
MTEDSGHGRDVARLREREITLQQILDNSTTVRLFAKDRAGRYLFVNRAFERHVGRPADEIVGLTPADIAPAEIAAGLRANDRRVIETGEPLEIEETNVIHGERRTLLANKFPLIGADGRPYAVCGISIDITERKRNEEALRRAALAVSTASGPQVFEALVRQLAGILGAGAAMISVFFDSRRTHMRSVAACVDGRSLASFEYELARSPCAGVLGQEFRYVREGVHREFAPGTLFAEQGFDSYAAYSIAATSGEQLGLIVAMDRRPLAERALVEAMLKIFAVRAAAEIERTRADEALRASEASYREIFEANEDAIFVHDWDTGAILDVSPKAAELYGHSRDALRDLRVGDVSENVPPYTEADAMRMIQQAKMRSTPLRFEWRARHRDGHLMWNEVTLKRATIGGEPRILAFVRDVTEAKRAAEAVRASEEQYRAIFNASADALVLWNSELKRVDVNPAYERLYGVAREEVLDPGHADHLPEDYVAVRREVLRRTLAGEACQLELEATRKGGGRLQIEVRTIPIRHRGAPHALSIVRDVTEAKRAEERLRASEQRYRLLFEMESDAILVVDAQTLRLLDANRAAESLWGYSRAELLALTAADLSAQADQTRSSIQSPEGRVHIPLRFHRRRDGTVFPVEITSNRLILDGTKIVIATVRDITERKRAEDALRLSEEQYRSIFDASADAIVVRDAANRIVDANPALLAMTGATRAELVGSTRWAFLPPEMHERGLDMHRRVIAGEHVRFETAALRKDGTRLDVEVRCVPIQYRGAPHLLAIARDITERKRAESALRLSEEQYRAIFDASADALVLRDAEFRIVDVNPAYEAMSGYRREEVVGAGHVVANPPPVHALIRTLHAKAIAGEPVQLETQMVGKDGGARELELRGVPIRHQGRPHVLYVGRDITERRRAEAERLALEAQLRQAQKMEAIGQLTGGIAHDFNNILTSIAGYVTLAAERESVAADPKVAGYLEQATRSCRRARDLIQQMLTFSRGQRGERRPVDLRRLVAESARLLHSSMPATLDLEVSTGTEVPPVAVDRTQAEQVLLNLCINARDAVQGQGTVRIGVRRARHVAVCASCRGAIEGDFVELAVSDDGPGIARELMERIFEPFFSTKEVGRGSGMGLAMVHGIVHDHGGHLLVDTRPGAGATFRALFPVLHAEGADAEHETLTGFAPAARRQRLRGRVLLVDDEDMVRGFMRELLEGWGLEVDAAGDGAEARALFARAPERYDLVITDQTMPRQTGVELARELAARRAGLPIILYSGYAEPITAAEVQDAGIRALVRKPVEPAALRALVESLLPGAARAA